MEKKIISTGKTIDLAVEAEEEKTCMSGIPSRPWCKGRNYDPNRYDTEE